MPTTRRDVLAAPLALAQGPAAQSLDPALIRRHDDAVNNLLVRQETDRSNRYCGGLRDQDGLWHAGGAAGVLNSLAAAYVCPGSRHRGAGDVLDRIGLAAGFLLRAQHEDGTIDLLTTNFHSTPDLGFVVHAAANAALLLKSAGAAAPYAAVEPFLQRAGRALLSGGVHTPNHRWVVCAALAQLNELLPDPRFERRIAQWLAEGVDIDDDGHFDERSTTIYNAVTDRALLTVAVKTGRPALLDHVRRNLDAMMYLLHPGFEVVTGISRRQDLNTRGDMSRYWLPLRYLAIHDANPRYSAMLAAIEPQAVSLPELLAWPLLRQTPPAPLPLPTDYEKTLTAARAVRIRRGDRSATIALEGNSRFFSLHYGPCAVQAVRFASAFFGKAQFRGERSQQTRQGWLISQELDGPYFQPLDPPAIVPAGQWETTRLRRPRSEVMHLKQSALVRETPGGFALDLSAEGTADVPLAVEISLRPGGALDGCQPDRRHPGTLLLPGGYAVYTAGGKSIRFGPGAGAHRYTAIRGAEPRIEGTTVYLCASTPFRQTLTFECL